MLKDLKPRIFLEYKWETIEATYEEAEFAAYTFRLGWGEHCKWDPVKMGKFGADLEHYRNVLELYGMLPDWQARKISGTRIMSGKARKERRKRIEHEQKKMAKELEEIREKELQKMEKPRAQYLTSAGESDMALVQHDLMEIVKNESLPRLIRMEARDALTELITANLIERQ